MKQMKKMLALGLVGCSLAMMACAPPTDDYKVLKIGYTHYQPMNYMDEQQGMLVGFDAEFARKVCDELDYEIEFVEIIWDNKVHLLQSGAIDCIWNGMTITEELAAEILVSRPYLANRQVAVVPMTYTQSPTSIFAFSSVAFENGGVAEDLLTKGNLPYSAMRESATQMAALAEVLSGKAEAAMVDYTLAKCVVGKGVYSPLSYVEIEGVATEHYGIGFRKDDIELCSKVNALIDKYMTDGTFDAWEDKYLG